MRKTSQPCARRRLGQGRDATKARFALFAILTALLLLAAAVGEGLSPYDPNSQDLSIALAPPSLAHPFGTDRYGRDLLARVLAGGRTSIFSTLALVAVTALAGTAAGVLCGCRGGTVDLIVTALADLCLAFPGLVLAMAIAAVWSGGVQNAVLALALVSWPKYARLARGQTLALRDAPYIQAARLAGGTPGSILFRHMLPNLAGTVLVTAMLDMGTMMMELAALSFLGLGAQVPTAEWGSMMSDGRSMLQTYPWVVLTPGLAIFLSVALFHLLGDAARDLLDPRERGRKTLNREEIE